MSYSKLCNTLGIAAPIWRVLAKAHDVRNIAEYEGAIDVDELLLTGLIAAAKHVEFELKKLTEPPS
jgi:hypothetical protein